MKICIETKGGCLVGVYAEESDVEYLLIDRDDEPEKYLPEWAENTCFEVEEEN